MESKDNDAASLAKTLNLDPTGFVEDLYNAAHCHCADSFDELDECIRDTLGPGLTPEQEAAIMKGTAALYKSCRSSLDAQLERFEKFALETCLHIPSDMVDREIEQSLEPPLNPEEDEAVDAQLQNLREAIVSEKAAARRIGNRIESCRRAVAWAQDKSQSLGQLADSLARTQGLAADVRDLCKRGMAVEDLLLQAQQLDKHASGKDGNKGTRPALAALSQHALARRTTTEHLERLTAALNA
ncbi:hypothetical protein H632_c501p1 [Helicosporidium sp. ATCC 50920]|nr:hypothetical protein H632_c501p1 [Helicosporidium sp. ATCC 50920]|eukprot:KDD75783.1 hypothetical protein H632_c501p1 [Helicosporidium sp. ATCC 50920]